MIQPKTDIARKNDSSAKNTESELNRSKCRLVKGPKPLQAFKFYLDIKNHAATTKLETRIKELGGDVEFFLVQEVTHVISDRLECNNIQSGCLESPSSLNASNESIYTNESPNNIQSSTSGTRHRTRADAMLEKVRSQSASKVTNPLQNAKLWGIPIWTVKKVLSWLEKVSASIKSSNSKEGKNKKSVKVFNIKDPFVKFEPIKRDARPVYKTLIAWPTIDLEAAPGKPAFNVRAPSPEQPDIIGDNQQKYHNINVANDSNMTRKQRTRLSVRGGKDAEAEKQAMGAYCEICHCEYRELTEHVRSEQHLNFVKNDSNFLELDSIITAGANVEAFLRLNGKTGKDLNSYHVIERRSLRKLNGKNSPEKCNGGLEGYSPPVTRNKTPRQRTTSNQGPLSPAGSDRGHHLRSRGHLWLPSNLLGTTAEDDTINRLKESRSDRRSCRLNDEDSKSIKEVEVEKEKKSEVGRPRRSCPKNKRVSADERLVSDNKTYYKVEVMSNKLRSSGLGHKESEPTRRSQLPVHEEEKEEDTVDRQDPDFEEQGLVVKFRRVRKSELSVLNDEAENFMFPRKEDPSFSDAETEEGPHTTKSTIRTETSDIKSTEGEQKSIVTVKQEFLNENFDDSLMENASFETSTRRKRRRQDSVRFDYMECDVSNDGDDEVMPKRKRRRRYTECEDESSKDGSVMCYETGSKRKKRRTQAEAFIADNQKYYKFETPGSRLRYQGTLFPQTITKPTTPNKSNGECTETKEEPPKEDEKPEISKESLKFAFEFVPKSEPWYQTFSRQDRTEEYYISHSDDGFRNRFFLPCQLPYIAPLDPKVCIANYEKKKHLYLKFASEGDIDIKGNTSLNMSAGYETIDDVSTPKSESNQPQRIRRRKKKSRLLKMNSGHPRKSPRQHASTLAILSSLIQQRKKRERKSQPESDTSRTSIPPIPEEPETPVSAKCASSPAPVVETSIAPIDTASDKFIKEILSAPMDDLSDLDLSESETVPIRDKPDAVTLILEYKRDAVLLEHIVDRTPVTEPVRTVRRKRKKNRTGWPKKKRLFTKRCEQKSEDGNCSAADLDDSRLGEFSADDDVKELCDSERDRVAVCRTNDTATPNFSGTSKFTIQGDYKCTERRNSVLENSRFKSVHDVNSATNNNCDLKMDGNSTRASECGDNAIGARTDKSDAVSSEEDLYGFSDQSCSNFKRLEECLNQVILGQKPSEQILNKFSETDKASFFQKTDTECPKTDSEKKFEQNLNGQKLNRDTSEDAKQSLLDQNLDRDNSNCENLDRENLNRISDQRSGEEAQNERIGYVDKWETAEKVLHSKVNDSDSRNNDKLLQYQPFVRVQKIENSSVTLQHANRRVRSSSPERKPKAKRARVSRPVSPRSPRKLRTPRGKWYRER